MNLLFNHPLSTHTHTQTFPNQYIMELITSANIAAPWTNQRWQTLLWCMSTSGVNTIRLQGFNQRPCVPVFIPHATCHRVRLKTQRTHADTRAHILHRRRLITMMQQLTVDKTKTPPKKKQTKKIKPYIKVPSLCLFLSQHFLESDQLGLGSSLSRRFVYHENTSQFHKSCRHSKVTDTQKGTEQEHLYPPRYSRYNRCSNSGLFKSTRCPPGPPIKILKWVLLENIITLRYRLVLFCSAGVGTNLNLKEDEWEPHPSLAWAHLLLGMKWTWMDRTTWLLFCGVMWCSALNPF